MGLREIRKSLDLSVERVAADLGVGVGTIRNWEQGRTEPSLLKADALATLYSRPLAEIVQAVRARQSQEVSGV